jgi:peptide/nickel transport system substrate-binding protein
MKKYISFFLIVINLIFISSCQDASLVKNESETNEDYIMDRGPTQGGTLNMFAIKPDSLNPLLTKKTNTKGILNFVFDSLIELDDNQIPKPGLAENWRVSDDGLTWTFKIRDDINWHDGIKLTAKDVEYTIGVISNPSANSPYSYGIENIESFKANDKNSIKIVLKEPNSFTAELMTFPIIPRHYYTGTEIFKVNSEINLNPVGSGPYKFVSYKDKTIIFERNSEWWGKEYLDSDDKNNMPYLDKIKAIIFDSENENVNAFLTKKVDSTEVIINESSKYSIRSDTTLKKFAGNEFTFLAMNLNDYAMENDSLRQAMAYVIDKTKIIDDIFPGEAIAADVPVYPNSWLLQDVQEPFYKYDVDKAKKILADGGWYEGEESLINNTNKGIVSANFNILVNKDNTTRVLIADIIKKQLEKVGIKTTVVSLSWDEMLNSVKYGDYDMALMACNITESFDLGNLYTSDKIGSFNISNYNSKTVDKNINKLKNELENEMRKDIFRNIYNEIIEDVPYIGLFFTNDAIIYNKRVRGDINPKFWDKYDIYNWYIPDGLRNINKEEK